MAMTNRWDTTNGIRKQTEFYAGYVPQVTLVPVHNVSSLRLSNVYTQVGNFRAPNAHRYVSTRSSAWYGSSHTFYYPGRSTLFEGYQSRTLVPSHPSAFYVPDSCYNKAYGEFVEKLRGSLDLSIDFVQWRQAMNMVHLYKRGVTGLVSNVNKASRAIDLFEIAAKQRRQRAARQGRLTRFTSRNYQKWYTYTARKLALELAQARAEYAYGWKPLASSIVGLGEVLRKPPNDAWIKVRGKGSEKENKGVSYNDSYSRERRVINTQYFCTIEGYFVPLSSSLLANLARISSLNPVSIAYEALPYSFVVDWFIDIGGWLRNVESAFVYGASFKGGRVSQGHRSKSDLRDEIARSDYRSYQTAYSQQVCFTRTPLGSMPMPRFPTFKMNFGLERTLNALAIGAITANRVDGFIRMHARK